MVGAAPFVASLVLVTLLPAAALAQVTSDSLDRIRARLSTKAVLPSVRWDTLVPPASCDESTAVGQTDAKSQHIAAKWFLGGVGSGLGLGLIGAAIATGASALTGPQPNTIPSTVEPSCYREGYRVRANKENRVWTFMGGWMGFLVWLTLNHN